jgi:hypothetical protein
MPEQYQLSGLILGQRWASTAACRAARAAEVGDWSLVEHMVLYLMGDPVEKTIDDFLDLGRHLAEMGRFPHHLPSQYVGALRLLEARAAPAAFVGAEVVPFRPNRGVYLIVDKPADRVDQVAFLQRMQSEVLPELMTTPGVVGAWIFTTSAKIRRNMFTIGNYRMTVCYLDDDPAMVGTNLKPIVERVWSTAPADLLLAAPYESMMAWAWDRFGLPPEATPFA